MLCGLKAGGPGRHIGIVIVGKTWVLYLSVSWEREEQGPRNRAAKKMCVRKCGVHVGEQQIAQPQRMLGCLSDGFPPASAGVVMCICGEGVEAGVGVSVLGFVGDVNVCTHMCSS